MTKPNPAHTYESFFVPAIFIPCSKLTLEAAKPARGERALDIACGTGVVARALAAQVGTSGSVTGVDISPDMLSVARTLVPEGTSIEFKQGSGTDLPIPDRSVDLVTCQHGLQFFPDRLAGTREFRRVLTDKGRAVVLCWKSREEQSAYNAIFEAEAEFLKVPVEKLAAPFSLGNPDELKQLLLDGGFSRVDIQPYRITASFPSADQFVRLTMTAGAAVMPEIAADLEGLIAHVQKRCEADFAQYRVGDRIDMEMVGHIAIAHA